MLGELKLRTGSNPDGTIKAWLTKIFNGFSLPDDFASRLLKSMEDTAARVLNPDGTEGQVEYLEIVVLASTNLISQGQIWGFFQVERTLTDPKIKNSQRHCIEYYLYLDRKPGG